MQVDEEFNTLIKKQKQKNEAATNRIIPEYEFMYAKALKKQEWMDFRQEILDERGNKCEKCPSTNGLHVHHNSYISKREPWEYPHEFMSVLCSECHDKYHRYNDMNVLRPTSNGYECIKILPSHAIK